MPLFAPGLPGWTIVGGVGAMLLDEAETVSCKVVALLSTNGQRHF